MAVVRLGASHPFPLHPSAVNRTCLCDLLKRLPRFRIGETKLDGNSQPALDGLISIASRMKTPPLDCVSGGTVQSLAAGAAVYFNGFCSTLIVDQDTEQHPSFTAFTAGAFRVNRFWRVTVACLNQCTAIPRGALAVASFGAYAGRSQAVAVDSDTACAIAMRVVVCGTRYRGAIEISRIYDRRTQRRAAFAALRRCFGG